jgi:DUF1009 family protein
VPGNSTILPKLGIVAGGGELPARLIEACQESGRPFFVLAVKDHTDYPLIDSVPHGWTRMGNAGNAEKLLRDAGVQEIVLAGTIRRPSIKDIMPDLRVTKVLLKAATLGLGDDGLLGLAVREAEKAGFSIVGAHTIRPDLLAPEGPLGRRTPDKRAMADIARGVEVVQGLGGLDIGQACVVQQGIVLGVEAIEGTDGLIRRTVELKRRGRGGVLVKMKKPEQDERFDMPTIGERTLEEARKAGLTGVAVEAGATIVLNQEAVASAADKAGLFVVGVTGRSAAP